MDLETELKNVETELAALCLEHARLSARIEGLRAERDALAEAMTIRPDDPSSDDPPLTEMKKDEAIVAVLKGSDTPLRIGQIVKRLKQGGRNEHYNGVSVYLNHLLKQGRVRRVGHGLYLTA
jgi:hypothetical protein